MCKSHDRSNCTRDKTENTVNKDATNTIEINCLKLPEVLYESICVLNGRYGTGTERKQILGSKYTEVQNVVNLIAYLYD